MIISCENLDGFYIYYILHFILYNKHKSLYDFKNPMKIQNKDCSSMQGTSSHGPHSHYKIRSK